MDDVEKCCLNGTCEILLFVPVHLEQLNTSYITSCPTRTFNRPIEELYRVSSTAMTIGSDHLTFSIEKLPIFVSMLPFYVYLTNRFISFVLNLIAFELKSLLCYNLNYLLNCTPCPNYTTIIIIFNCMNRV